jgi:hypothetical protein
MLISIELDLGETEIAEIASVLESDDGNLAAILSRHFKASALEYLAMYRGQKVFRRGSDLLEYRLLLLIETAFEGVIPDEHEVARLFQTTPGESRALIRSILAKYQYRIKEVIKRTISQKLAEAGQEEEGGPYSVVINSVNIVLEMNRILADLDGSLQPVKKKRGCVSTYEIMPSSFEILRQAVDSVNQPQG